MPDAQLLEKLDKLRLELARIAEKDVQLSERLSELINEIENSATESKQQEETNLLETIGDSISHFETEHPRTTAILNEIMVTLSNMGI